MSVERTPDWLPDGWTTEFRETRQGKYRYYKSLASGCTFLTKEEVFRYLNVKDSGSISETSVVSNRRKEQIVEEVNEYPDWLPSGWVLEIKTRTSGKTAGKLYKCYLNPLNGSKFYSKNEVLQFLGVGKVQKRASNKKKQFNRKLGKVQKRACNEKKQFNRTSTDNVIAHIKHSPDGLPYSMVKETTFRESKVTLNDDPSPHSVKALESPQNTKKCRISEEILDLNGQLTEKRLFPDGLLLSPSSNGSNGANSSIIACSNITNGDTKADEKENPEAALSSIPSSVNVMIRTASSGKMLETTRCEWNSDGKITKKLVKAKKENDSVKLEKMTQKSSSKSNDLPLIDIQPESKELVRSAEDEVNLEEQIKPMPSANLNEKSNGADSSNLPLPPYDASKTPDGAEFLITSPNANRLQPHSKHPVELQEELLTVEENLSRPNVAKSKPTPKHRKRKDEKMNVTATTHRRSSRRLAGVAADPMTDWDIKERSLRSKPDNMVDVPKEPTCNRSPQRPSPMVVGELATSLFRDSWPDPCLEFAFKTLTGDLPVMEEAMAIQEYFQQQLLSVESSGQGELASLPNDKMDAGPGPQVLKLPGEQDLGGMNLLVKK